MEKTSKWTQKRKNSIDCNAPKGFSERAHCQGKKKRKMKKSEVVLNELNKVANYFENIKLYKEASAIHNVFIKVASEYKENYNVNFPMNLDDALNNYDSGTYFVDQKGITLLIRKVAGKMLNQFLIIEKKCRMKIYINQLQ